MPMIVYLFLPFIGLVICSIANKPTAAKIFGSILCLEIFAMTEFFILIFAGSGFIYELFGANGTWLSAIACLLLFFVFLTYIWGMFSQKARMRTAIFVSAFIIAMNCAAIAAQAYKNSFIQVGDTDMEISLVDYMPFRDDSEAKAKSLDKPASLSFTENLPLLDGATALYPLYAAFAQAVYPKGEYFPYKSLKGQAGDGDWTAVACSQTDGAIKNLLDGNCDIAFIAGISNNQAEEAKQRGVELALTPIGKEAFVFIVNSKNKIEGLTQEDIRKIYSGEATNWKDIGGPNLKIDAYQRKEGSGSQTALEKIMGGRPVIEPKEEDVYSFMGGLYRAIADYRNYKSSIGYSFRFYIEEMLNDKELKQVKLLKIDGQAPTPENIANGKYPFSSDFYAATVSNRTPKDEEEAQRLENAQKLISWILSEEGQELVAKTGYVKIGK